MPLSIVPVAKAPGTGSFGSSGGTETEGVTSPVLSILGQMAPEGAAGGATAGGGADDEAAGDGNRKIAQEPLQRRRLQFERFGYSQPVLGVVTQIIDRINKAIVAAAGPGRPVLRFDRPYIPVQEQLVINPFGHSLDVSLVEFQLETIIMDRVPED